MVSRRLSVAGCIARGYSIGQTGLSPRHGFRALSPLHSTGNSEETATGAAQLMSVYLGVDVGTSGTKTLAMRGDGRILASATANYLLSHPRPGWSEQNPEDWWQATVKSVRAVLKLAKIKPADVAGIGLSGQMHGSVFLDSRQTVI